MPNLSDSEKNLIIKVKKWVSRALVSRINYAGAVAELTMLLFDTEDRIDKLTDKAEKAKLLKRVKKIKQLLIFLESDESNNIKITEKLERVSDSLKIC